MNTAGFEWQRRLVPGSPDRESALRELRLIMLKGVRAGLFRRPGTDDDFLEDVVQSAMIRVLDHLDRFEGRSAFTTWAIAIALRRALEAAGYGIEEVRNVLEGQEG
jgi:RNA polymerase sigma-70 factor (ECF subfamily)